MANVIILSAILLSVVGINYGCMKLAVLNPNIISGFELSEALSLELSQTIKSYQSIVI